MPGLIPEILLELVCSCSQVHQMLLLHKDIEALDLDELEHI